MPKLRCHLITYSCVKLIRKNLLPKSISSIFAASVIQCIDYQNLFWVCPVDRLPNRRLLAMHLELCERIHVRAVCVAAGVLSADISRIDPVRSSCSISFWYNGIKIILSYPPPPPPRNYQVTDATWRSCRPHAAKLAGRLTFNWFHSTVIICHTAISEHVVVSNSANHIIQLRVSQRFI